MGTWDVGPFDNDAARDLLWDLRAGRFSLAQFRFETAGDALDADDGAVIVALSALSTTPSSRLPEGLCAEHVAELTTPQARRWLRLQHRQVLDSEISPIYAMWEDTGELEAWIDEVRAVEP